MDIQKAIKKSFDKLDKGSGEVEFDYLIREVKKLEPELTEQEIVKFMHTHPIFD